MQIIMTASFESRGFEAVDVRVFSHKGALYIPGVDVVAALRVKRNAVNKLMYYSKKNEILREAVKHRMRRSDGQLTEHRMFTLHGASLIAKRIRCAPSSVEFMLFLEKLGHAEPPSPILVEVPAPEPAPTSPSPWDMPLSLLLREWFWRGRHV